ncbi:dienelactone hydrolase family protein [Granulicoccus phenolivorans]|uniref:dienelactone hydrolase family protein n=1 Tax=Granulicoccus phenolivorans TaxID=266854 RepID=UPI0004214C93|nr:dienelactone hydrolase family protein [Granulicoccus phenolivorans]
MTTLTDWTPGEHTHAGIGYPTYRRGTGPGVIVIHEIPGLTPAVLRFADEVVDAGFTVVLPHLFGPAGADLAGPGDYVRLARQCLSGRFTLLATGVTTPMADWLRSLARTLHTELGGPGVGALGMCFTGGFALAMMVDDSVSAPILAQPSAPFPLGKKRAADLNLSPADTARVVARAEAGCPVLGLRYADDRLTGTRFATLKALLGDRFTAVEFPGAKHGTLTTDRQQAAVDAVLAFLADRLR